MLFPDYFRDRVKNCLELARRMRNPQLAQTFSKRARLLMQTAVETERSLSRINGNKPSPGVVISQAKTLNDLKRELEKLSVRTSVCVPLSEYSRDQKDEFWRACPLLTRQFRCSAEFRPDGCLWFVKRL